MPDEPTTTPEPRTDLLTAAAGYAHDYSDPTREVRSIIIGQPRPSQLDVARAAVAGYQAAEAIARRDGFTTANPADGLAAYKVSTTAPELQQFHEGTDHLEPQPDLVAHVFTWTARPLPPVKRSTAEQGDGPGTTGQALVDEVSREQRRTRTTGMDESTARLVGDPQHPEMGPTGSLEPPSPDPLD